MKGGGMILVRIMFILVLSILTAACGTAPVAQPASTDGPTAATTPTMTVSTTRVRATASVPTPTQGPTPTPAPTPTATPEPQATAMLTPLPEPDAPSLSAREAVAVVKTWLSRAPLARSGASCLGYIAAYGATWDGEYLGNGEWRVSASGTKEGEWLVFERTLSVSPDHDGESTLSRSGC